MIYKILSYKIDELFSSPFRMNEGVSGSLINISSVISFMAAFQYRCLDYRLTKAYLPCLFSHFAKHLAEGPMQTGT